ncbi:hypothetical protein O3G_MSEX012405 [Manduca sexta]|uniref:Uncharacterized protein n=1 Tax=Manduca sexta TaxID=7130 RepID=A0A921ZNE5_MANSE|nr:hypothetical protein O3G_MSEX012405 [Manduca sexta]
MLDLKACTVCFSTDSKLYNLNSGILRHEYNLVSGLHTQAGNGLPEFLCVFCLALVRRFVKFRDKCQRAHYALQEILNRSKEINKAHLQLFNRKEIGIMPPLSYLDLNQTHYEDVKFQWVRHNRLMITTGDAIPIAHYSTLTNQDTFCNETENNNVKTESADESSNKFNKELTKEEQFIEPTNTDDVAGDDYFDDNHDDDECDDKDSGNMETCKLDSKVDGSQLEEEYASIYPISVKEAKAALEVYKLFSSGKYRCTVCNKSYHNEERLNVHSRMHDKHTSGNYHCNLCDYYYKTDFLLQTHMTEKHIYKYVCRKCPEVSFDRISAKQHYIWSHLQKGQKKNANWYESRPSWLSGKGGKRVKGVVTLRPVRKMNKLPDDFLIYTPIGQEEQYQLVKDRKKTRNYIDSVYKCELCYRGFRESATYEKHMKKHDPAYAGNVQCDMCKLYFRDSRKLYKHMNITHLFKYSCQLCSFFCVNRSQAHSHYRWHKNVTYSCPHCDKVFNKLSTRLTHIRIKHPSTNICNLCGHSFVSENGLYCHKQIAHSIEEREQSESAPTDPSDPYYCADCGVQFLSDHAFATHLGSSNKHASTNLSIKPSRKLELASKSDKNDIKKRGRPRMGGARSDILNNGLTTSTNCEVVRTVAQHGNIIRVMIIKDH